MHNEPVYRRQIRPPLSPCHEFIDFVIRKHTAIFITLSIRYSLSPADCRSERFHTRCPVFPVPFLLPERDWYVLPSFCASFNINTFILPPFLLKNARDKITFTLTFFIYLYKYIFFAHYFTHQNSCRHEFPQDRILRDILTGDPTK